MDLTVLLDVAIGLTLVYLGASLFVTILNEYLAQFLKLRGRQLAKDLKTLIDDPGVITRLTESPVLSPFFQDRGRRPSYVDPNVLARMLVGAVSAGKAGVATMQTVLDAITQLPDSGLKSQLLSLSRTVKDDVEAFVQQVAHWADRSLTSLGEAYKRHTQMISLGLGLVVAIGANLNTIGLVQHLYRDKDAREALASAGVELVASAPPDTLRACLSLSRAERGARASCAGVTTLVSSLRQRDGAFGQLPIGWPARSDGPGFWMTVAGWLLTALAVSLGASFWFDLLNRLVNVRHGMRRPEVSVKSQ
jgi:hypothetical protein